MNDQPENKSGSSCGAVPWLFMCGTVAYIAYLVLTPHTQPTPRLWVPVVVETNGSQTILGESRQLEFWTPSARTKDYLGKKNGVVGQRERWEVIDSDDIVTQFGAVLHSNVSVFGYRRVEEWGQGRTTFKPGWWWTMNVTTNYSVVELEQVYQKFWHSTQPLLIEVIDNRGSAEK
ncbi:MAG TPA: hypothetical protein VH595_18295 [Verrucomicrobiae bacterium]|jgi:hypothetical protein|nr:hypothetical protein [Verrucomicrobiae bacterium]